ncbi:MAG: aldo/keto reductase, partial [Gemmatimonadales bacterium]
MQTRKIGSLEVSVVGLGCNNFGWRLDAEGSSQVVGAAIDNGINFFDTADIYGGTKSEEFLGRALGARRASVIIATKFGMKSNELPGGAGLDYVRASVENSLRRLGTDYIDLYQLHQPDPSVPIAETLGALEELRRTGRVREIGCSKFSVEQIREADDLAQKRGTARFVSVQNEYSLLHRDPERGVLEECKRRAMAFVPYFPLASGLLTGKYRTGRPTPTGTRLTEVDRYAGRLSRESLETVDGLIHLAEARGRTILDLAFGWLLSRPVVSSVIAGATSPEQVKQNAASATWRLTAEELEEVDAALARPA